MKKRISLLALSLFLVLQTTVTWAQKPKTIAIDGKEGLITYVGDVSKKVPYGVGELTVCHAEKFNHRDVISGTFTGPAADNNTVDGTIKFYSDWTYTGTFSYVLKPDWNAIDYTLIDGKLTKEYSSINVKDLGFVIRRYYKSQNFEVSISTKEQLTGYIGWESFIKELPSSDIFRYCSWFNPYNTQVIAPFRYDKSWNPQYDIKKGLAYQIVFSDGDFFQTGMIGEDEHGIEAVFINSKQDTLCINCNNDRTVLHFDNATVRYDNTMNGEKFYKELKDVILSVLPDYPVWKSNEGNIVEIEYKNGDKFIGSHWILSFQPSYGSDNNSSKYLVREHDNTISNIRTDGRLGGGHDDLGILYKNDGTTVVVVYGETLDDLKKKADDDNAAKLLAQKRKAEYDAKRKAEYDELCKKYGKAMADCAINGVLNSSCIGMPADVFMKYFDKAVHVNNGDTYRYDLKADLMYEHSTHYDVEVTPVYFLSEEDSKYGLERVSSTIWSMTKQWWGVWVENGKVSIISNY